MDIGLEKKLIKKSVQYLIRCSENLIKYKMQKFLEKLLQLKISNAKKTLYILNTDAELSIQDFEVIWDSVDIILRDKNIDNLEEYRYIYEKYEKQIKYQKRKNM